MGLTETAKLKRPDRKVVYPIYLGSGWKYALCIAAPVAMHVLLTVKAFQ